MPPKRVDPSSRRRSAPSRISGKYIYRAPQRVDAKTASQAPKNHRKPPHRAAPKKRRAGRTAARVGVCLGVFLVAVLCLAAGGSFIFCKGPSPTARDLFVNTMLETSALKFVPYLFLSDKEVEQIVQRNAVVETGETTEVPPQEFTPSTNKPMDTIEIEDVSGPTYKGKMMIVYDPSRVQVACLEQFSSNGKGKKLETFVEETGAVAGVNAGGFADENGMGNGGMPLGVVVKDGVMLQGTAGGSYQVIGFDQGNHLIVGQMTGAEMMERGMRDAVSFGPAFIINGKPVDVTGSGGGLNPRTVIGQREDGAVLLLVIDGRQPHSLGANFQDCIKVMQEYGAINAANLDGGSSTQMIYQGETVNICASLYGPRYLPTVWVVQ